jgi:NADH:ubiquinone oxidoreductase subunit F (NADH-binding)
MGEHIKNTSFCGLGQAAPNPLLRCLDFFEEEFRAHLEEGKCFANTCSMKAKTKILI